VDARSLTRRPPQEPGPAERAAARLRALLEEVTRLDAGVESLSRDLETFSRAWDREVGPALRELAEAEKLVLRLQRLEEEAARLGERLRDGPAWAGGRKAKGRFSSVRPEPGEPRASDGRAESTGPDPYPDPDLEEAPILPETVALKRLWRRLARVLHPDLAATDGDRERSSALMARANAAYEAGDLAALELMAERVGAGEDPGLPDEAERLAHIERRAAALAAACQSLAAERARLLATDSARLVAEAERRRAVGGDLATEAREEARDAAGAALGDARARLARLFGAARGLERAWRTHMDRLARRGPTGALRPFDPLAESALVRAGARLLEATRAGAAARELARRLEEEVRREPPVEAALTLLAFLAEAAGSPPDGLASATGLEAAWAETLAPWPGAPDLARALARLPRHLAPGFLRTGGALAFGVHLAGPDLGAGVRIALRREAVAALARRALSALGPSLRCGRCRRERRALHLLRVRGLDEVHALACPACGAVLRSYWRYGEPGGLEALAPLALELGLVAEVDLDLGGATLGLQMLPEERERLTAAGLRRRVAEALLAPYRIGVGAAQLRVLAARRELGPRDAVPAGRLRLAFRGALSTVEALELLRARIERRFRE
jgi:hypothetical protein